MEKIYDEYIKTDEEGAQWLIINGSNGYRLDKWTKEEAEADFLSPEAEIERQIAFCRAYGFYD